MPGKMNLWVGSIFVAAACLPLIVSDKDPNSMLDQDYYLDLHSDNSVGLVTSVDIAVVKVRGGPFAAALDKASFPAAADAAAAAVVGVANTEVEVVQELVHVGAALALDDIHFAAHCHLAY